MTAARRHYHVHSTLGGGYLCECDAHYPYNARGRDVALRDERDGWRDYCADAAEYGADFRISGSVRSGGYVIDDRASMAWIRYVESWACSDPACYEGLDD